MVRKVQLIDISTTCLLRCTLKQIDKYLKISKLNISDARLPRQTDPLGRIVAVILITVFILCVATLCVR